MALSSLIQALEELDMVAVTRRIYNKNSNPVMGALFPDITANYEVMLSLVINVFFMSNCIFLRKSVRALFYFEIHF